MIAWLFATLALAGRPSTEDARIEARIEAMAPRAAAVVADGQGDDWAGLDLYRGEGAVRAVGLAPTRDRLNVWVELAEPLGDAAVWLAVDAGDTHSFDGSMRIDRKGVRLRAFGEGDRLPLPEATVGLKGRFVEISVPWKALSKVVSSASGLSGGPSDIVRVRASRWEGPRQHDPGLAVASYLLDARAPRLDPPLPHRAERPSVPATMPLSGTWFVLQGAWTDKSHRGTWAYDFVLRDASGRTRADGGRSLEGVLAFGEPVHATGRGTVQKAIDGFPDRPLDSPGKGSEANRVRIDYDDGTRMTVLHLKQGTVAVRPNQRVQPGQVLGRIGNSGHSSGPHLHAVWAGRDGHDAPAVLQDVIVGLNPGPDDPWARRLEAWPIASGYYVRAAPPRARKVSPP